MRAAQFHQYGPPDVLVVENVPVPQPKEREVLIRVHAAGVNPIDWKLRAGQLQQYMPVELPYIPGYDVAGTVEAVGPNVSEFTVGQAVFGRGTGTYAEYAVAPVATLAVKPHGLSFDEAATIGVGGVTSWLGLFNAGGLESGQRLFVQGAAGGTGSFAVQLGDWKGAHVIGSASTANLDYIRLLGADEVVDYTVTTVEDVVSDVDVVYDTLGGDATEHLWKLLNQGGILVEIAGMPSEEKAKEYGVRTSGVEAPPETSGVLRQIAALIEDGALEAPVGRVFSFDDAAKALGQSETGHGRGRIVLHIAD
jgi:NADPH:quinone reductase-like Zn-dependent oxidoreductase